MKKIYLLILFIFLTIQCSSNKPTKDTEIGGNPLRGNADAIQKGKTDFGKNCANCHAYDGSGLIGPSLIDTEWLHGKTDAELYQVINKGIPASQIKLVFGPMPAFEKVLTPTQTNQILAWLASINPSIQRK